MRLNAFLWNTFLESSRGREWVDFFSSLEYRYIRHDAKLKKFMSDWADHGLTDERSLTKDVFLDGALNALRELRARVAAGVLPKKVETQDEAGAYFQTVAELASADNEDEDLFYCEDIPELSQALFCMHPEFFFPYYFCPNFHVLKMIFDEFGIFFPPPPSKRNYDARFHYYLELCKSLNGYWSALGLAPEHLPIFLYGYAPEVIDIRQLPVANLPKPHRAWFVGGGINNNGDFDYLDKASESSQVIWQGSPDTEIGDIVLMYCLSPRSCVHSVWRAIRPGGADPFHSFHGKIWIGFPRLVKALSLADIKADPVLSKMPLVKGNMQGINGRQIPKQFYDRILELLKERGENLKDLPSLEDVEQIGIELKNESDVEIHILEPLLKELGFKNSDWERQVKLRVGRAEKCIPDYLIHTTRDSESKAVQADWVWEAKFSINNNDQLQKDFAQACSYGRLVNAQGVGLVSKEGIWVSNRDDDFSPKKTRHWSAPQLLQSDSLNEIRVIAGKKRFKK